MATILKLVGGSLSLVSVVLIAVLYVYLYPFMTPFTDISFLSRVLNLLVATILGLVPSLTAYVGSFTAILTPVLQNAGVSLPGVN